MGFFVGIDGGGTGSRGIVVDADDRILAEANGDALNPYVLPEAQVFDHLLRLVEDLIQGAEIQKAQVLGVCAGLAGLRTQAEQESIEGFLAQQFSCDAYIRVTHDLAIALYGGVADGEGVVVVAGTGAAAYGQWKGQTALAGGCGQVMGDEGSGYWLGVQALRAVAQAVDGRGESTALLEIVSDDLRIREFRDLVAWSVDASKADIAQLGEIVIKCEGDSVARQILGDGALQIARMAGAVIRRLEWDEMPVVMVGGLMAQGSCYFECCRDAILKAFPRAVVWRAPNPPVWGAAQLVRQALKQ